MYFEKQKQVHRQGAYKGESVSQSVTYILLHYDIYISI